MVRITSPSTLYTGADLVNPHLNEGIWVPTFVHVELLKDYWVVLENNTKNIVLVAKTCETARRIPQDEPSLYNLVSMALSHEAR